MASNIREKQYGNSLYDRDGKNPPAFTLDRKDTIHAIDGLSKTVSQSSKYSQLDLDGVKPKNNYLNYLTTVKKK
jgi:hypothetical protein